LSGRGNFDRVVAPTIEEPSGWRTYPPSNSFRPEDDLGVSGTKTFEVAVIPEAVKTAMPRFAFSYFDPSAEKYVTLTTTAAPLTVEPGTAPTPAPVPHTTRPAEEAAPEQPQAAKDIVGLRYDTDARRQSFEVLYESRKFWLAQLLPLVALLACLFLRMRRPRENAEQLSSWRRERSRLHSELASEALRQPEFYETAARIAQLEAAIATGREPASIDAAAASKAVQANEDLARRIEELFNARAELLYAGGGGGDDLVPSEEKAAVLSTLRELQHSS
jgi:hypothetical protein